MRDAILAKLAEVEEMLLEATLDGEQLGTLASCVCILTKLHGMYTNWG